MWQVWYCVAALSGLAALFFEVLVKKSSVGGGVVVPIKQASA